MSVQSLMEDARFDQLSPQDQRKALVQIDPRFNDLNDTDFSKFLTTAHPHSSAPAVPRPPLPRGLTGPQQPGMVDSFIHKVTSESPLNPMNWPGMVSSAFESPFSDRNMNEARHQTDLITGKEKVQPIAPEQIPGMVGEGLGDLANAGITYGVGKLPGPKMAAVAKGAGKGAWQGGTELIQGTHWPLNMLPPMPAAATGAATGAAVGKYLAGEPGEWAGGLIGGVTPAIRGAVSGGKAGLRDFKTSQVSRPAPSWVTILPSPAAPPPPVDPIPSQWTPRPVVTPAPRVAGWQQAGVGDQPPPVLAPVDPIPAQWTPRTPVAPPATSTTIPAIETPAGAPAATSSGSYAFTHPKESLTDLRKQIFATGQQLELPGSPAKTRATEQIRQAAMDNYGRSVSQLDYDELFKLNEFLAKHHRLPGLGELK